MPNKSKNKVLVTGANGYLGSHVVKHLLDRGINVLCLDLNNNNLPQNVAFVNKNIFENNKNIYEELGKPEVLIHLAWRKGFVHNAPEHMSDLSAHFNFLCDMLNGGLKNLSVMGSMHEVGYHVGRIDENTPCKPLSQYGIAKHALQTSLSELIGREHGDVCFKWLRGFYIYGDDEQNCSVFTKILQAEKAGQEYFPFNSGKNKYDFIHIDDMSEQIVAASLQQDVSGIINCCSGKPVSLAEKALEFISLNGLKIKPDFGKFPDRPYDSPEIFGDNSKIAEILKSSCGGCNGKTVL